MKTIFDGLKFCLAAAVLLPLAFAAEEAPKNGFVRLADAVAIGTGNLTMEIDGKKTDDTGYSLGEVTGGISLPLGNRTIRFIREGVKEGSTRVNIVGNETTILIPFAEK